MAHKKGELKSKKSFRKGKKVRKLRSRRSMMHGAREPDAELEAKDVKPPKRKTGKQADAAPKRKTGKKAEAADDSGSAKPAPKPKGKPGRPRKVQPEHLFTKIEQHVIHTEGTEPVAMMQKEMNAEWTEPAPKRKPKAAPAPKAKRAKVTAAAEPTEPAAKSAPKATAKATPKAVAKGKAKAGQSDRPWGTRASSEAEDEKYVQYYAASFSEYGGLDAIKADAKEWLPVYEEIGFDVYWTRYSCGTYFKKNGERKKTSLATFAFGSTLPGLMVAISCAICLVP